MSKLPLAEKLERINLLCQRFMETEYSFVDFLQLEALKSPHYITIMKIIAESPIDKIAIHRRNCCNLIHGSRVPQMESIFTAVSKIVELLI